MKKINFNTGVFWGSFDPPTIAHKQIILKMQEIFNEVIIIVNNNLAKNYYASVEHRVKLVQLMLQDSKKTYKILQQNDAADHDYFALRKNINSNLYVTAGIDAVHTWLQTHSESEFAQYDGIYIVPRVGYASAGSFTLKNLHILELSESFQKISSTLVRSKLITNLDAAKLSLDTKVFEYIIYNNIYTDVT